jgi:hypothetical protein
MNYDDALSWAMNIMNSPIVIGHRAAWGLITVRQIDAMIMAQALGGDEPPIFEEKCPAGVFHHYHVNGRLFLGVYKYFHVWYFDDLLKDSQ